MTSESTAPFFIIGMCCGFALASLGAWLARRRSTARPGEAMVSAPAPMRPDYGDLVAIPLLNMLVPNAPEAAQRILISGRLYLEDGGRRRSALRSVAAWWYADHAEKLLRRKCEWCESAENVRTSNNGSAICAECVSVWLQMESQTPPGRTDEQPPAAQNPSEAKKDVPS
jgi:hypothetical protein